MAGFMTDEWAQACRDTLNGWPGEERRASKLQDFWDWIDMVKPFVTGVLALNVRETPPGAEGDTLMLDLAEGTVTAASVTDRGVAEGRATFLLAGSLEDWTALLEGYDPGKMVMYRKLMLEQGETLQFFLAAFFWTELLAAIQTVPTGRVGERMVVG